MGAPEAFTSTASKPSPSEVGGGGRLDIRRKGTRHETFQILFTYYLDTIVAQMITYNIPWGLQSVTVIFKPPQSHLWTDHVKPPPHCGRTVNNSCKPIML